MKRYAISAAVAIIVFAHLSVASDGDLIAETASATPFRAYVSDGSAYVLASDEDIATWPVTWRTGESVNATAMDGTQYALSSADEDATCEVLPGKGGAWTLVNSEQGNARVCIPWSVCQGYGVTIASGSTAEGYAADTVQDGPNRKSKDRVFPSIAYSGDDWRERSETAQSELTIVSPSGDTVFSESLTGTGVLPFSFDKTGKWLLSLRTAEGTMLTATVNIVGGFTITVL